MASRTVVLAIMLLGCALAGASPMAHRKSLIGRAADAVSGIGDAVGAHVDNGVKATKKIATTIGKQSKGVAHADEHLHKTLGKAAGRTIDAGEKALGAGAHKLADLVTAPLTGGAKHHHGGAVADKELQHALKAVDKSKQQVGRALDRALEERQHALGRATKKVAKTVEHTKQANGRATKDALRKVQKVLRSQLAH